MGDSISRPQGGSHPAFYGGILAIKEEEKIPRCRPQGGTHLVFHGEGLAIKEEE